jgi:hypothetical protein
MESAKREVSASFHVVLLVVAMHMAAGTDARSIGNSDQRWPSVHTWLVVSHRTLDALLSSNWDPSRLLG